jgi:nitroimidazol reductase NimA-like FMN-containing flavoprotein (pyridoxamine 5'-phosphate oxidase superfamily)
VGQTLHIDDTEGGTMGPTDDIEPRTGLEVLDEDECWRLLESRTVGRLAVDVGGHPDIFPVNYVIHDRMVVIRTEAGTKLAGAVLGTSVAFEIDEIDESGHSGWSVVVRGRASEPRTVEEEIDVEDLGITPWVGAPKTRWLRIAPLSVTGRRIPPPLTRT